MIKIDGIVYMALKEAAIRYNLPISWFKNQIDRGEPPHAFKLNGRGKIYYDVNKTDEWFKSNMKEME